MLESITRGCWNGAVYPIGELSSTDDFPTPPMQFSVALGFYGICDRDEQRAAISMRAEYTLTRDDYDAYFRYMQRRVAKIVDLGFRAKLLIWCLFVLLVFSVLHFVTSEKFFGLSLRWKYVTSSALTLMLIGGMIATYYFAYARRAMQAIVSEDSPLLGDYKIEVLEDGLRMSNAHAESKYAWSMFRYIVDDADYIYLLHDNGVGQTIPKRAFRSEQEVRDFLSAIDAKLPYSQTSE